jgi:hypothetical protein
MRGLKLKIKLISASIATLTLLGVPVFAQTPPVRLVCEFKSPVGQEAQQRYLLEAQQRHLLEIVLESKTVRSTQFVNGVAGATTSYEISTANEQSIVAVRKDAAGRSKEAITINRFTAEAQFHFFSYGTDRDTLWNDQLKQMGGFKDDPVRMSTNGLICRGAVQQF